MEPPVPAAPPPHLDTRHLRGAFGQFATGVCVVAACGLDGTRLGATVNSFTSVSLEPALLLVCIARAMRSHDALVAAHGFTVNVLHHGQQEISRTFATAGADKWACAAARPGAAGGLILRPHLAYFDCATHARHEGGDHTILVGAVLGFGTEAHEGPLVYFRGRYATLHAPAPSGA